MSTPPLLGVHHSAYRCRDAEETRVFYEDILGLKLRVALTEDKAPGTGSAITFQHLFFELGDGRFIAFFDEPAGAAETKFTPKNPFDQHIAFEAPSMDALAAFQAHLAEHGVAAQGPVDHGFCHSIYFWDPNGLALEITARDPGHETYMQRAERTAHVDVVAWLEKRPARPLPTK